MTEIITLLHLQATKASEVSYAVPTMPGAHCPDELGVRGAAGTGGDSLSLFAKLWLHSKSAFECC